MISRRYHWRFLVVTTEASIDARSVGRASEPAEGYDAQQDSRDEKETDGQDKTASAMTELLPHIDHSTASQECVCRHRCHLARPRMEKARKANAPSGTEQQ